MSVSQGVASPYSRIIAAEVWNFMSIEHGKIEFDETNIINLKGYNDSGKSSILTALRVALLNSNPSKQASFIQDDKEYFRVVVYFDDGVQLMRDKYINGQSLIEMYKDGQCIFTTKNGKALTRITEIPQPVADYLGLVTFDGGALNARSCFEKQLGVQTTGAENYKMFNTVLKSEEIATAGALLNNDKNKLAQDINAVDQEIQAQKSLLGDGDKVTDAMILWLKARDSQLDDYEDALTALSSILALRDQAASVPMYPAVEVVDVSQLNALTQIKGVVSELGTVRVSPEVPSIDGSQLSSLSGVKSLYDMLAGTRVAPEVPSVDNSHITMLLGLSALIGNIQDATVELERIDTNIAETAAELERLQTEAANHGSKLVKCPSCGELFDPELMHQHA